ncbi:MAG: P-II family nitrogen regulator [Anaerovoracaceae bacterium]
MEILHLVMAVSDRYMAEKVIGLFQENNIFTTDVVLGEGTAPNEGLEYLYQNPKEKAIVFGVITHAGVGPLIKSFKRKLYIDNPGNGIVVTVPLNSVGGKRSLEYILDGQTLNLLDRKGTTEKGGRMSVNTDFELIFVIANEGYTDMIMDAARSAGASGGTVIKAKGTGADYTEKFFGFSIASEKEIHLIVVPAQGRNNIMKAIMEKAGLNSKAQSIVFSLPVSNAIGLRLPD